MTETSSFAVRIATRKADACGNRISPPTAGEVYRALAKHIDYADSIEVEPL